MNDKSIVKQRNPAIELYRVMLMFGICLIHVAGKYGPEWYWISSGLAWCVPGFVFISGWFGIRFSIRRVLAIYGIALWCCPISSAILLGCTGCFSWELWWRNAWQSFLGNWFIHAYIVLVLLSPLIEAALERVAKSHRIREALPIVGPFLVLVFGWSYLAGFNFTKPFVPRSPELAAYSGVTLAGVYAVARTMRFCEMDKRISTRMAALVFVISVALSTLKIAPYNSLIALAAATSGFFLCAGINLKDFKCVCGGGG